MTMEGESFGIGGERFDIFPARSEPAKRLQTHASSLVEKALEYRFLGAVTSELLSRHEPFEILRGDIDHNGYDTVIEARGVTRHVQLKGMIQEGRRADVSANIRLAAKASGCIVWMTYDPASFELTGFRWFGGFPGRPIPDLGDRAARHSRGNRDGIKAARPDHRIIPANRFEICPDIAALVDRLFGPPADRTNEMAMLRSHIVCRPRQGGKSWVEAVRRGDLAALPSGLNWVSSFDLARLVDCHELAMATGRGDGAEFLAHQCTLAEQCGRWPGSALDLWLCVALAHRAWHFSSPAAPTENQRRLLDTLVRQLCQALA